MISDFKNCSYQKLFKYVRGHRGLGEIPMGEVKFEMKPVEGKPSRTYRKGSKYDPILDQFIKGDSDMVAVTVEGKSANYVRTQLTKRIEAKGLSLKVSVVGGEVYLENKL